MTNKEPQQEREQLIRAHINYIHWHQDQLEIIEEEREKIKSWQFWKIFQILELIARVDYLTDMFRKHNTEFERIEKRMGII